MQPLDWMGPGLLRLQDLLRCGRIGRRRRGWRRCRWRRVVVSIGVAVVAAPGGVGNFDTALGRQTGVLLAVANGKRELVFRDGLAALAIQIKHAAEIDVRPGEEALILAGGQGLVEVVEGLVGMAGHERYTRQDEVGACAGGNGVQIVRGVRERLICERGGALNDAGSKLRFGQVEASKLARLAAAEHFSV